LGGAERLYLQECLDSNWVSSAGPFVERFEQMVADYLGTRYAVAMVNGTAALHVALLVAGVRPDDEVLVSALSFIAPANAIRYVGAWPVFIDAEPDHWQMDPGCVARFLERDCRWTGGHLQDRTTGRRVTAILPVHILGHPVDLDPILEWAEKFGLVVVEDATESLGAEHCGRKVGNLGHIACLSFNGNKLITTGGGGMLVTNDERWALRARHLSTQAKQDVVEYVHDEIGFNFRLTNIQAALGVAQMERIEAHIAAKRAIAAQYTAALRQVAGLSSMAEAAHAFSVYWLYTVLVDEAVFGMDSRRLMHGLEAEGIQTRPLWQPLHRSPAHADQATSACPVSEMLNRRALSLPSSVGLEPTDQQRVIRAIEGLGPSA
jgi:perosamine synthetase